MNIKTEEKSVCLKQRLFSFLIPLLFKQNFFKEDDIADALTELSTNGLIKLYSDFGFLLKDSAIIYMENRLQNKVNLIFDIISKIVSMLH